MFLYKTYQDIVILIGDIDNKKRRGENTVKEGYMMDLLPARLTKSCVHSLPSIVRSPANNF